MPGKPRGERTRQRVSEVAREQALGAIIASTRSCSKLAKSNGSCRPYFIILIEKVTS